MLNAANISVKTNNGKEYAFIHDNGTSYISFSDGTALRYKLLSCGPIAVGFKVRGSYEKIVNGKSDEYGFESEPVTEIIVNL